MKANGVKVPLENEGPNPIPSQTSTMPEICREKTRLLSDMLHAASELIDLQVRRDENVAKGVPGLRDFDAALATARMKRENTRQAYLSHIELHR
jgi:hypothetical protein